MGLPVQDPTADVLKLLVGVMEMKELLLYESDWRAVLATAEHVVLS